MDFFSFAVDGGTLTEAQKDKMLAMDMAKLEKRKEDLIVLMIEIDDDFGFGTSPTLRCNYYDEMYVMMDV